MIRIPGPLPAATRILRFYAMDDPLLPLEVLLAVYDSLYAPVYVDAEGDEVAPPRPSLLSELSFAQAAAWLRACWTPAEVRKMEVPEAFGSDLGWWT